MKIGVFDSGIGGLSVVKAIEYALPTAEVLYASDHVHMPYGDKQPAELLGYVLPILQNLEQQGCRVIVIACNTITTTLLPELKNHLYVPLIGIEPMVKPAAELTKTNIIAVCATPTTLASARYAWLKNRYASAIQVLEPDCSKWAYMIEHSKINERFIEQQIEEVCAQKADVIVLGCTHYHWIERLIKRVSGKRAVVLQPEAAVVAQLKTIMKQQLS